MKQLSARFRGWRQDLQLSKEASARIHMFVYEALTLIYIWIKAQPVWGMCELLLRPEFQFESARGETRPDSGTVKRSAFGGRCSLSNHLMRVETLRDSHVPPHYWCLITAAQLIRPPSPSGIFNTRRISSEMGWMKSGNLLLTDNHCCCTCVMQISPSDPNWNVSCAAVESKIVLQDPITAGLCRWGCDFLILLSISQK